MILFPEFFRKAQETSMKLERKSFGKTSDGKDVSLFLLENSRGLKAEFISYGAVLKSLVMPGRGGVKDEITLGFDTLAEYEANRRFFGATIGRFANRIAKGKFYFDGKFHTLATNNGKNHLHGGVKGFDRAVWDAESFLQADVGSVVFSYLSPDGEEGYPGNLRVTVTYTLTDDNELSLAYDAETDEPTPVNLTNHTFWNLAGAGNGTVEGLELELRCPFYLPVDDTLIPTGEILSVRSTPMDFTAPKPIGRDIDAVPPAGYDHCFVIGPGETDVRTGAVLKDPGSGRKMEVLTDAPGIQFYSGNLIKDITGAGGRAFGRRSGLCLETQLFPDAVNRPYFRSPFLYPGVTYRTVTIHRFGVE
jgi:aldose 1-epimerase